MIRSLRLLGVILLLSSTLALVAGCSQSASLEGTSWRLVGWSVSAEKADAFPTTLAFEGDQASGQAAVNGYGATFSAKDGSLTLGDVNRTLMAGSPEADAHEKRFFELLEQVERYAIDGETLTLSDAEGNQLLTFESAR